MNSPSKFHPLVSLIYWVSRILGKGAIKTPHQRGGELVDKIKYEYNQRDNFWKEIGIDPTIMTDRRVIDIGCGFGGKAKYYAETFAPTLIFGIDYRLTTSISKGRFLVESGNAESINWESEDFDIAMMEDVMEHVEKPLKVLQEAYRVLRPGGLFICKFPSIKNIVAHHFDRATRLPGLHYLFSFKTLAEGLNYINEKKGLGFQPFSEIVNGYPSNLNGMTIDKFKDLVKDAGFKTLRLECIPYWHFPGEIMSKTTIYVGTK